LGIQIAPPNDLLTNELRQNNVSYGTAAQKELHIQIRNAIVHLNGGKTPEYNSTCADDGDTRPVKAILQECEELTGVLTPEGYYILPTPPSTPEPSAYPTPLPTLLTQLDEAEQPATWKIAAITGSTVAVTAVGIMLMYVACKRSHCTQRRSSGGGVQLAPATP
jgi:hypothetical protein